MRLAIWIYFSLLTLTSLGQTIQYVRPITDDVSEIEQINFNGLFRSGWRSYYSYRQGDLLRQRNYFKSKLRYDASYEYSKGENWKRKKHIYTNDEGFSIEKTFYTNDDLIERMELFFDKDTLHPVTVWSNFNYEHENLQSCKVFHQSKFTSWTECHEYKYHDDRIKSILFYDSCAKLTKSIEISYNSRGYPTNEIIDYKNPEIVINGGRSEKGIQRFYYKFDKKGNWTKRYYVTSSGRKIREIKRKIKYETVPNRVDGPARFL